MERRPAAARTAGVSPAQRRRQRAGMPRGPRSRNLRSDEARAYLGNISRRRSFENLPVEVRGIASSAS
jgi:hypothetical protein